jgi:TonB family protein
MGELFLARADGIAGFAKLVAVKRIVAHKATNDRHIRMLLDEARLVASLQHPNIAQVYDVGVDQGQYFFAMEYVHGQDLRRVLHRATTRKLQLENCLHIAIGICAGLHHAHEARDARGESLGIVHRDVSPGNVLVSYDGAVKLVDFGVAKASTFVSETREGMVKGKYGYMSPEQCLGAPLDRRSDLFAVGILLWEMAVGRRLYKIQGELATLQRVVYVDAPRPSRYAPGFPRDLERIIMRALARDPAQRYATAEELQLDLENFAVEHKLSVSAVAMNREMSQLFKDRIDAWQEAERLGRSLADHLAELAPDDLLVSDELDGVIGDLDTNVFTPDALVPIPGERVAPTAHGVAAKRARTWKRRAALLAFIGVLGLAAASIAFFAGPDDVVPAPAERAAPAPIVSPAVAAIERDAGHVQPTVTEFVATEVEPETDAPTVEGSRPADELPPEPVAGQDKPKPVKPTKGNAKPSTGARREQKKTTKTAHVKSEQDPVETRELAKHEAVLEKGDTPADVNGATKPAVDAVSKPATPAPVPGTVDANEVRAVVRSHLGEIQACVSRARMDDRDLKGRVTMRIELSPSGSVTNTSVSSSSGATPSLETCMRKAVATWTFPAPAGGVAAAIRYPFAF